MEGSYLAIMLSISCSLAFSRHLACTRNMASRLLFCSSSVSPSSPLGTIIIRILQRVDVRSPICFDAAWVIRSLHRPLVPPASWAGNRLASPTLLEESHLPGSLRVFRSRIARSDTVDSLHLAHAVVATNVECQLLDLDCCAGSCSSQLRAVQIPRQRRGRAGL